MTKQQGRKTQRGKGKEMPVGEGIRHLLKCICSDAIEKIDRAKGDSACFRIDDFCQAFESELQSNNIPGKVEWQDESIRIKIEYMMRAEKA